MWCLWFNRTHTTDKCNTKLGKKQRQKISWSTSMLISKWVFDPDISHVRLVNLWYGFVIPIINVLKLVEASHICQQKKVSNEDRCKWHMMSKNWAHVVKISRFQSRIDYLLFLAGREKRMNNGSYLPCIRSHWFVTSINYDLI
jgi:hypothetical protein